MKKDYCIFWSLCYNENHRETGNASSFPLILNYSYGGNTMAFVITDECLSCGSCAAQCPAEAIDMGDLHYEIDQSKCLECGACAAQCPAEAIENV